MKKMLGTTTTGYEVTGNQMIVHLPGEMDDHNCKGIREDIENILRMHDIRQMIFDFSTTTFMDSSGLGVLLGRCRSMKQRGGVVFVYGESERIHRILSICGVYQVAGRLTERDMEEE